MPGLFSGRQGIYQPQEIDETYSFENDFEGWTTRSYPTEPNLPAPIPAPSERTIHPLGFAACKENSGPVNYSSWQVLVCDV